jgi:hypothetical protein
VQRRVGFDAVDQRGAARRRGKHALERDDRRAAIGDDLERPQRVGVGKGDDLVCGLRGARLERVEQIRRPDHDGAARRFGHRGEATSAL